MNEPREISDPELQQVLRSLPREAASEGFTAEVLARAARSQGSGGGEPGRVVAFPPRRLPGWSGWLMAAAALLMVGLGMREWQHRREVEESMRRIAELRGQYQELASELQSLRREAASARPVLFVGATDQVDLVVDLERLASKKKDKKASDPEAKRKAEEELAQLYRESAGSAPVY